MMHIANLLSPTIDYVFKRIFGYVGNEVATAGLLSAILNTPVANVSLDTQTILEKDLIDDKIGILDIKANIGNDTVCDIEMQFADQNNILERLLFYWSKVYEKSIKSGQKYAVLKKTIVIMFADFELKNFNKIKKYITQWNIREKDYTSFMLTKYLELYIIELPKIEKYPTNTELDAWVKFIKNPEVLSMKDAKNNKALKTAKKVLEDISKDEHEIYLAELRQKYIMDQEAMIAKGYDNGVQDGIQQGKEEIILNMFKQNIPIEEIAKLTNLDIEKIKDIIKQ